jgi:hypothetical protein
MGLIKSYQSKTPSFWRNITRISLSLKAASLTILGLQLATPLPEKLTTAAGWVLGVCLVITAYSESRVEKPTEPCDSKPACGCSGPCNHTN